MNQLDDDTWRLIADWMSMSTMQRCAETCRRAWLLLGFRRIHRWSSLLVGEPWCRIPAAHVVDELVVNVKDSMALAGIMRLQPRVLELHVPVVTTDAHLLDVWHHWE